MIAKAIDPTGSAYAQSFEVTNPKRFVFVSGQVPEDEKGNVPADFKSQCRLAWKNVEAQLAKSGMTLNNIVKFTVFLSDRKYRGESYQVRAEVLGKHEPAMTIIIAGIYDEVWLLEIEVTAAD